MEMTKREMLSGAKDALLEFVKRASKKGAAPEEVKALPEVASVLLEFLRLV